MIGCYHLLRGRHVTRTSISARCFRHLAAHGLSTGESFQSVARVATKEAESRDMFDPHFCFRGSETRSHFLNCGASLLTLPEGRGLWLLSSGNAPEYGSDGVVRTLDEMYNLCTRIGPLVLYLNS